MFLKIILISLLYSVSLFSLEIEFHGDQLFYKFHFNDKNEMRIKNRQMNLSLVKNECNAKLIDNFILELNRILKISGPLRKESKKGDLTFRYNDIQYFDSPTSPLSSYLKNIPDEIHRLKFEEKYKCQQKPMQEINNKK